MHRPLIYIAARQAASPREAEDFSPAPSWCTSSTATRLTSTSWAAGKGTRRGVPSVWLPVLAITIHNLSGGLSVGVVFGAGKMATGTALAMAIGLQNVPEGLAVAVPLVREG